MTGTTKLLLFASAGLIAGLLLAPESGKELRNDIADSASKWRLQLGKLFGRANGKIEDLKGYLNDNIDSLSDDVKRKIIDVLDNAENLTQKQRSRLQNSLL